jgi:hypothetical protein
MNPPFAVCLSTHDERRTASNQRLVPGLRRTLESRGERHLFRTSRIAVETMHHYTFLIYLACCMLNMGT